MRQRAMAISNQKWDGTAQWFRLAFPFFIFGSGPLVYASETTETLAGARNFKFASTRAVTPAGRRSKALVRRVKTEFEPQVEAG